MSIMTKFGARGVLAALLATAVAGPAAADAVDDCSISAGSPEYDATRVAAACDEVIASGEYVGIDLAWAYNNRGVARNFLGRFEAAIEDLNEAIRLDPAYAIAHNNRAWAYEGAGDYVKALADADAALRIDPEYAQARNTRSNLRCRLGDVAGSVADRMHAIRGGRWAPMDAQGWLQGQGYYNATVDGDFDLISVGALYNWTNDGCPGI